MLKAKSGNELVRRMNIFAEVTEARSECLQEVFETKIVEFCNGFDLKKNCERTATWFHCLV